MKKKATKRKLVIILTLVMVLLITSAIFQVRIPQRIAASQFNKESSLPYSLLSALPLSNGDYCTIDDFGIKGYYDRKYADGDDSAAEFDAPDRLRQGEIVICWISSYPDAVLGSSKITGIECSDPAYRIFGCAAGDDISAFSEALVCAGFKQSGYFSYTKCGIRITLTPNDTRTIVSYFSVRVESGNLFRVQY